MAAGRGLAARLPRRPSTRRASPRCTARSWSSRRPSRARTCSGSTTSAARPTSRSRRSSTSRCSSASSSGCTRSVRCFGPSRTTPSDTWPSTSRSTSSSASSATTSRSSPRCATWWRAWSQAIHERAGAAVELLGIDVPEVPAEFPVLHFREALEIAGAPADEPDLAPAHERALGAWAKEHHGSDFVVVEGYPTASRAFYSHPDPADPHWSRSFDLIFRGIELVSGAQRLHRYDDYVHALRVARLPAGAVRRLHRRLQVRHPSARRLRDRAWSAGPDAWSRPTTSARSPCSPATCTGWHPRSLLE